MLRSEALEVCFAVYMTDLSIQDATLRSGLTEPTLRYYEEVGHRWLAGLREELLDRQTSPGFALLEVLNE